MTADKQIFKPWWGDQKLGLNETGFWQIGPFRFWLNREKRQWRFSGQPNNQDLESNETRQIIPSALPIPEEAVHVQRLAFNQTHQKLRLMPLLADRSVVVRPSQPVSLPPKQKIVLYFSSPLWLQVEVDEPLVELAQIPLQRPSDTWFGPNTREGELCYSLRTSARMNRNFVPHQPHRVLTEVNVVNLADSILPIDIIQVPLPAMSLYAAASGQLWTQVLTLERRDKGDHAELKLGKNPPEHAVSPRKIASPRERTPRTNLIRAFGGLIGGR